MDMMRLGPQQRIKIAELSGEVQRLGFGNRRDWPLEQKLAELHGITRDPQLLGHVLGVMVVDAEMEGPAFAACAELLRAAGADEQVAGEEAAAQRERRARLGGGPKA